ncbi:hypothetical protein [Planococcus notacanthi]|uniref:hypothetical protein n=1 Tax=Planococcus notacanthi TaxID=3035188 RepID=UPI0025B3EAEB|nr:MULTISPECIES: hypothetical protein [Terrabacteria group]
MGALGELMKLLNSTYVLESTSLIKTGGNFMAAIIPALLVIFLGVYAVSTKKKKQTH